MSKQDKIEIEIAWALFLNSKPDQRDEKFNDLVNAMTESIVRGWKKKD